MRVPLQRAFFTLAILTLAESLLAIRPYQQYWKEYFKEYEAPEIIEDNNPPIEAEEEYRLFEGGTGEMLNASVFPGELETDIDPVARLALGKYVEGSVLSENGSPVAALKAYREAVKKDPENVWIQLRAADAAIQVNDLSSAEAMLRKILEVEPDNYRANLMMGELYQLRRRYSDAKEYFNKVLESKPRNISALQSMARMSYEVDQNLELVKEYSHKILTVDDRNLAALLWNAEASALTGDAEHAADLYSRLIRYRPQLIIRMGEMARRLTAMGQTDNALAIYERAVSLNPEQPALRREWENTLTQIGGDERVREAYEALLEESFDARIGDAYVKYLKRQDDWEALVQIRKRILRDEPQHIPSLMDMAEYYLRQEDFDSANPFFLGALSANPSDPDVYRQIAIAHMEHGDRDKARRLLQKTLLLDENDIEAMSALATMETEDGDFGEAEKILREALDQSPANGPLLRRLGDVLLQAGKRQQAKELFGQTIIANQYDFETWLRLAEMHLEDGETEKLDLLEDGSRSTLEAFPEVEAGYGMMALRFGEYERARRALQRSLRHSPEDLRTRKALSEVYLHLEEESLAREVLEEAKQYTANSQVMEQERQIAMAELMETLGDHGEALEIWESLSENAPENLRLKEQYILALGRAGKDEQLTEELNELVRNFKVDQPQRTDLIRANVYLQTGEAPRAVKILQRLHKEDPGNLNVLLDLALASGEAGDIKSSEELYRRIIKAGPTGNPYYETAHNNLGYLFAQKGIRLNEALELIEKAHELNPQAAYIMDSLGWVHFQMGNLEKARKYLEEAAALVHSDSEIFLHLAELYEATGEKEKARRMYDKVLRADPNSQIARERRDALLLTENSGEAL